MIRNCDYCGTPYEGKRKSSRFCCAACRVNFNLLPGKLSAYAESAENVLARMVELVDRYPHLATQFIELSERLHNKTRAHAKSVADRHPIQRKLSAPPPPAPAKRKTPAPAPVPERTGSAPAPAPAPALDTVRQAKRAYAVRYRCTVMQRDHSGETVEVVHAGKLLYKSDLSGQSLDREIEIEIARQIPGKAISIDFRKTEL